MGQSSCGNSVRAVTACGRIEDASLDDRDAYKALEIGPRNTLPLLSITILIIYQAYQEDGVYLFCVGTMQLCGLLRDVHIIAGWLSCVLHLLLLALMIPPLYVAIDRSPQQYKRDNDDIHLLLPA